MAQAKEGDTVKVHYTVKLGDGTVIGSTSDQEPLKFKIGEGQIIAGFEQALVGMNPGESKTIEILAADAFGPRQEEMVVQIDRQQLPAEVKPQIGEQLQFDREGGGTVTVTVTKVSEESITIDANHPLAGKDLTFDIRFLEVI